jgi:hypothetical protein
MEPIEFQIYYHVSDMKQLTDSIIFGEFAIPIANNGPFSQIIRNFELKKRKMKQEPLTPELQWAAKFMEEK